jgi:hypothetical protein
MSALDGMICGVNPDKAYARLEQLMAERDAVIPPPGASRDSPEFAAFMAAENRVGPFIAAHEHELAALRLPRDGMTAGRYQAKLAEMDAELDWLAERAVPGTAAQEAYIAAWKDRTAFAANYAPSRSQTPDPNWACRTRPGVHTLTSGVPGAGSRRARPAPR